KANALYKFMYLLILFCVRHDILISVENPANSHFWAVLAWFAEQDSVQWPPKQLEFISFDACVRGSERPKRTAILGTRGVFARLGVFCDGAHEHAPWRLHFRDGCSMWSTAAEARPLQLAAQGHQSAKFPPLIPEFHRRTATAKGEPKTLKVGYWLVPDQHVAKAKEVGHPFDSVVAVESISVKALEKCMSISDDQLEQQRKLAVLKLKIKARTLEQQEQELHKTFQPWFEKVARKKLLLWESLLKEFDFDDLGVIKFMKEGVPIVGQHHTPGCFKSKLKPALISEEGLRESAEARREAMLLKRHQQEPHVVKSLEATAREEVEMGILEGPMSADEVTATLGHRLWSPIRRFGLDQGSKIRPIDDGRESQTNNAFTSDLKLDLQGIDYMANLAMLILRAEKERSVMKGVLDILGWDFARDSAKGVSFGSVLNVLGVQMDISCLHQGTVVLTNKPERIDKLVAKLKRVEESGSVTLREAQVLLGWFNFASGHAMTLLQTASPRLINCFQDLTPVMRIWTDGSWEDGEGEKALSLVNASVVEPFALDASLIA
ncbi:unnamed protein product, partial [Symbiodinium pilosum]